MSESVFCHACMATTNAEPRYSNAGDRVCPTCESDFIELMQAPAASEQPRAEDAGPNRDASRAARRNQGFHRHFTTPAGHNVHLHVVTSTGGIPQPLEALLSNAEPAQLTTLLQSMQGMNFSPFNLPPGVSAADYGPNGGAAFDNLLQQLMEAHQPQASPTSRDTLASLPRRKVRSAGGPDVFSNTPNDLPAACGTDEPCSVCHDSMGEGVEVVELPCQHCYHEECITSWLKDHNTCPVCRKELPVDEELRNQQQQSRQQRFQQEVQRQPAGLQSLFGALNPFHLLGRNRNNTEAAPAATQNGGSNSASQAQNSNVPAAGLPSATAERLDIVRSSLQELEARLQQQLDTLDNSEDRAGLERQIAEAQAQRAHLQDSADVAVDMLQRSVSADANVLQVAQELNAALGQSVQSLTDALQRDGAPPADVAPQTDHAPQIDHDDMPSLCSTTDDDEDDITDADDSEEVPELEADLSPSEHSSDSNDSVPDLIPHDDLHSTLDDQPEDPPATVTISPRNAMGDMLHAMLQPQAHGAAASLDLNHPLADIDAPHAGIDHDEVPALVDWHADLLHPAAASGRNTPLDLDQQEAVDDLECDIDETSDLIERMTQSLNSRASSAAQSPEQLSSFPQTPESPSLPSPVQHPRRVVQRISNNSTPQNPAGPLQQQPSGLALVAAPDSVPEGVRVNSVPATQEIAAALPPVSVAQRPELLSHPLVPTPSRKRSFDPSEASSMTDSPSAITAQRSTQDSVYGNRDGSDVENAQQGQQRGAGLFAPVAWAARGAGRLVGTILRRTNSSRR